MRRLSDAEQLLCDLVAMPSPSGQETDAARLLVDWMAAHGYDEAYVDEAGSATGVVGDGACEIVLLGHIDTVGGDPPVRIEGRRLYGRGAVDAKGPLCAFAAAAARARLPGDVRLVVIGAVEEEAATSKGAHHALARFNPAACIIGEPSGWDRITLGYKGRLLLDWRWEGALAHSAGPVASPAERAFAYWQRVQTYAAKINAGEGRAFWQLLLSLRRINSGDDGVRGWAEMSISLRLPPSIAPGDLAGALEPDDGVALRAYGAEPAFTAERDTSLSRALRGAIRAQGGRPRFVYKTGTSDMNVVGPMWRCPIVAYGPGDSALDHTPDEHINLDEYLQSIGVLVDALERIAKGVEVLTY
jgi:LysW-gamma-L-lysine carboxypeptidase